jgi:hypothetical protein
MTLNTRVLVHVLFLGERVFYFVATKRLKTHVFICFNVGTPLQTCQSGGKLASQGPKEDEGMMLSCTHVLFVVAKKGP